VAKTTTESDGDERAVAEYKRILKTVLDSRPSGMRLRLAHTMGKNRSFISQISNPIYQVPIPARHLSTIFEVCHFSPAERDAFLKAYGKAHPDRIGRLGTAKRERVLTLHLPDLGSRKRNGQLDALVQDFVHKLVALLEGD